MWVERRRRSWFAARHWSVTAHASVCPVLRKEHSVFDPLWLRVVHLKQTMLMTLSRDQHPLCHLPTHRPPHQRHGLIPPHNGVPPHQVCPHRLSLRAWSRVHVLCKVLGQVRIVPSLLHAAMLLLRSRPRSAFPFILEHHRSLREAQMYSMLNLLAYHPMSDFCMLLRPILTVSCT